MTRPNSGVRSREFHPIKAIGNGARAVGDASKTTARVTGNVWRGTGVVLHWGLGIAATLVPGTAFAVELINAANRIGGDGNSVVPDASAILDHAHNLSAEAVVEGNAAQQIIGGIGATATGVGRVGEFVGDGVNHATDFVADVVLPKSTEATGRHVSGVVAHGGTAALAGYLGIKTLRNTIPA